MPTSTKYIYAFGSGKAEGHGLSKALLGGKGAGLAEMTAIGLHVPAGFTITTEACAEYFRQGKRWPAKLDGQIQKALKALQRTCGRPLGDSDNPLLVSVRSGAAVSMPGMMETILNLGLNDESVEGLARVTANRRFALDGYRRLIMMYGATAAGIDRSRFDEAFDRVKELRTRPRMGVASSQKVNDADMSEAELASVIDEFKSIFEDSTGRPFPQDPQEQLRGAINAVFDSWMAEKAVTYRRVEKITGLNGTAVSVCQMVFGNLGDDSGTGVCFTRDPSSGENVFYGDVLINAQGEDVVAGIRTPMKVVELETLMPQAWDQLLAVRAILELHYQDMQDLEFTIERGKLYLLQCRTGKRSPQAAFRIAVEQATTPLLAEEERRRMVKSKTLPARYASAATKPVISKEQAIARIAATDIERLFCPVIDPDLSAEEIKRNHIGRGIGAVPGAASGIIAFHPADAERQAADGEHVILVRRETSPEDVGGMHAADGILTATGGKTSHAAVVARGWGKCCIVGCDALRVDEENKTMSLNGFTLREGDLLTLDGSTGSIYEGSLPLTRTQASDHFETLLGWCDDIRRLKVRANADAPDDARRAVEMGAQGIGLCRTEHMFFETQERRLAMQQMIVADSSPGRRAALDKLQPFQKQDFIGIFEAMDGKPVTIRLVDPPLHEFLPHTEADVDLLAEYAGISPDEIRQRTELLHESNPMLGHRGCRLCMTYPEILEMQVSAIIEAAVEVKGRGVDVLPEIMIPLTIDPVELRILSDQVRAIADAILGESANLIDYMVGTMVETPRAALLADRIADVARFISFGTNDLTQTTMGLSRDDAGRFLPVYVDADRYAVFADDPFQSLDQAGVGMLVEWAVNGARRTDPRFKIGVCGEHGGDPKSIKFFHDIGLDYVSCSPFRLPVARLAAAQAVIQEKREKADKARSVKTARATVAKKKKHAAAAGRKEVVVSKTKKRTAAGKKKAVAKKVSKSAKKRTAAKKVAKSTRKTVKKKVTKKRATSRASAKRTVASAKKKRTAKTSRKKASKSVAKRSKRRKSSR